MHDEPDCKSDLRNSQAEIEKSVPVDVIVVGAGPAGISTAIAATQAGLSYKVIEKGVLVNSIFNFPRHMTFFTTPELLEVGGLPLTTSHEKPSRLEALRYYRRVADFFRLRILFDEKVRSIEKLPETEPGSSAFRVETKARSSRGRIHESRFVVLATGYYDNPNLLGIPGENLSHVSHYYSEPHEYFQKRVVVVGGKNSAAETALDLYRSGARVTLVHRDSELGKEIKYWVRPDILNRIQEGSIQARFSTRVAEIRPESIVLESQAAREEIPADAVFLMTGYHPDIELLLGAGVRVDKEMLIPDHNPETLETNVAHLYLAGAVVAGRNTNRVFIENGRFHGEVVIQDICRKLGRKIAPFTNTTADARR